MHTYKNRNSKIRHYTTCILVQTLSRACLLLVLHHGDSAQLKQTGIQIAKNFCQINFAVGLNNQELKKLIIKIVDARGKFIGEIMYHLASYYLVQNRRRKLFLTFRVLVANPKKLSTGAAYPLVLV